MATQVLQLCADDFGLSDGVSLGIIDLIRRGRLSAASCMMAGAALEPHARELGQLRDKADIGLHLTFTDLAPIGAMPRVMRDGQVAALGALMRSAFAGGLDRGEIRAEIDRQINRFEVVFGHAPDFVDGHQHVHLLPVIRHALFDAFREGRLPRTTAVRNCAEAPSAILARRVEIPKTLFISALSSGIASTAARLGVPTNDSFRGVTAFDTDRPFGPTFKRFLAGTGRRPLAMCHPALPGYVADPTDVIASARPLEYAYLASDEFGADLEAAHVVIGRHPR